MFQILLRLLVPLALVLDLFSLAPATALAGTPTISLSTSPVASVKQGVRVRVIASSSMSKICFSVDDEPRYITYGARLYFQNYSGYETFTDGCLDVQITASSYDLDLSTYQFLSPGSHTIKAYFIERTTSATSNVATYSFDENHGGSARTIVSNVNGGSDGRIVFNFSAYDDSFYTPDHCYRYRNSLNGIEVTENDSPYTGAVSLVNSNTWPMQLKTSGNHCSTESTTSRADVSFQNSTLSPYPELSFGEVNAYLALGLRDTSGTKTYKFKVKSSNSMMTDFSSGKFSVTWPTINANSFRSFIYSGLVLDKAVAGQALTIPDVANTCTVWVPSDQLPDLASQSSTKWSSWAQGAQFTASDSQVGTTIYPVRYLQGIYVNSQRMKNPCSPSTSSIIAPYVVGSGKIIAGRMKVDWGDFESSGIQYGKSQSHTVTFLDKGFGVPQTLQVRQKVGTGKYSTWKQISTSSGSYRFKTNAKTRVLMEFQVTDATGTYTISGLGRTIPKVTPRLYWKTKTYVGRYQQGGTIRIVVGLPSWYKGKVMTCIGTSHAYDFMEIDNGDYQKCTLFKKFSGSTYIDVKVAYHGTWTYSLGFSGNPDFSWSPQLGYDFHD
jgi:hypothetical protein